MIQMSIQEIAQFYLSKRPEPIGEWLYYYQTMDQVRMKALIAELVKSGKLLEPTRDKLLKLKI